MITAGEQPTGGEGVERGAHQPQPQVDDLDGVLQVVDTRRRRLLAAAVISLVGFWTTTMPP